LDCLCFFFYSFADPRDLHSFPTRALPISVCRASGAETLTSAPQVCSPNSSRSRHIARRSSARPASRCLVSSSRGSTRSSHKATIDRKSTRLNSSHEWTSYAVFCLKKKKEQRLELVALVDNAHLPKPSQGAVERCSARHWHRWTGSGEVLARRWWRLAGSATSPTRA